MRSDSLLALIITVATKIEMKHRSKFQLIRMDIYSKVVVELGIADKLEPSTRGGGGRDFIP